MSDHLSGSERRTVFDWTHPACGHTIREHGNAGCHAACSCRIGRDSLRIMAVEEIVAARLAEQREQIARDIEAKYLGADFGWQYDGRESPDAAQHNAYDEGLHLAAEIARGVS